MTTSEPAIEDVAVGPGRATASREVVIAERRIELDWLRVGVVAAVFVFHTARFFDPEGWHVKNATVHGWLVGPIVFFVGWAMPLLFVISGAGVFFALRRRSPAQLLRERMLRLAVPLLVGVFTHVMWQVYLERISHGEFRGSFLAFVPRYFVGWYGSGGNFAWMGLHLWFLEWLLVFTLALLPLFLWLGTGAGKRLLAKIGDFLARPGAVFLLALPIALVLAWPEPVGIWCGRGWGGWSLPAHACFFAWGFLLASSDRLYDRIRRQWVFATLVSAILGPFVAVSLIGTEPAHGTLRAWLAFTGMALVAWSAILAILGGAIEGLRRARPRFLRIASEAVLPVYVLHQTVILTVGYPVVQLAIPDLAKWALIFPLSLLATAALYLLVRRYAPLRVLVGMRP